MTTYLHVAQPVRTFGMLRRCLCPSVIFGNVIIASEFMFESFWGRWRLQAVLGWYSF
jgi:hypothetical protein